MGEVCSCFFYDVFLILMVKVSSVIGGLKEDFFFSLRIVGNVVFPPEILLLNFFFFLNDTNLTQPCGFYRVTYRLVTTSDHLKVYILL